MSLLELLGLTGYGMLIGIALAAPIGPVNIEIIARGIRHGFMPGWLVGLGALTADTIYATVVVSGLTPLADSPSIRAPLFLGGAIMLGWVGVNSIRNARQPETERPEVPAGRKSFVTGFLLAALNPMGIVYWLSVGAALVAEAVERVGRVGAPVLVGGVFLGLLIWVTALSLVGQVSRKVVTGRVMQWITGISGIIILGFAVWFLIQGIRSIS